MSLPERCNHRCTIMCNPIIFADVRLHIATPSIDKRYASDSKQCGCLWRYRRIFFSFFPARFVVSKILQRVPAMQGYDKHLSARGQFRFQSPIVCVLLINSLHRSLVHQRLPRCVDNRKPAEPTIGLHIYKLTDFVAVVVHACVRPIRKLWF